MGADLLLASVKFPRGLFDRPDEARAELERRIDAMSDDALAEVSNCTGEDDDDGNRRRVREAIDVLFEGRRDVIETDTGIESGGMSWGDSPTESFDDIELLVASGICVEPMPWAEPTPTLVTITEDVSGDAQESEFTNATLQTVQVGELPLRAFSVATRLTIEAATDDEAVRRIEALCTAMAAAAEGAAEFEVQYGPNEEPDDDDGTTTP